jgi:hypothetical protein
MKKTFVMRGQTASGQTEVLNFGKYKQGYAYRLTEFILYPGVNIGGTANELVGSVTAGKTAVAPTDPNFNNDGLIGVAQYRDHYSDANQYTAGSGVINDTYVITQNLILMVQDVAGSNNAINWQCRFESVKMSGAEEASVNYKQFAISDE